ncbi:MAG: hypothetical protein M9949_13020 [Candidatus Kapabacteria bacterium]|nr:hypothetical protein [Candidatus Kapabacteria bacterium]
MANTEVNPEKNSSSRIDDISENIENGVFHLSTTNQASKIHENNNSYKSYETVKINFVKNLRERKWKKL